MATHQGDDITRRRLSHGECWVASIDGRIVGTVLFEPDGRAHGNPYYETPGVSYFGQFGVDPPYQKLGIGRALLDHLERRAADQGAREIACDTAEGARHLIDLYERRGYRKVGEVDWPVTNYNSVILSKKL